VDQIANLQPRIIFPQAGDLEDEFGCVPISDADLVLPQNMFFFILDKVVELPQEKCGPMSFVLLNGERGRMGKRRRRRCEKMSCSGFTFRFDKTRKKKSKKVTRRRKRGQRRERNKRLRLFLDVLQPFWSKYVGLISRRNVNRVEDDTK
jgi:hypothetical protein